MLQRPGNAMKMTLQLASFFLLAGLLAVHGKTKYINKTNSVNVSTSTSLVVKSIKEFNLELRARARSLLS